MRRICALAVLVVMACAESIPPLEGIDLPPASLPDQISPSVWSVAFTHSFGENFWTEGQHSYQLSLDCPQVLDESLSTAPVSFNVVRLALPTSHVYLRVNGLSETPIGPMNVNAFPPIQPTTAIVTLVGVSGEDAQAALAGCQGEVR